MSRKKPRAWFVVIAAGSLAGVALGLLIGWVLWPPQYVDAEPALLNPSQQSLYIELVGLAFAQEGELETAQARLRALQDPDIVGRVEALALERLAEEANPALRRALALLAQALGANSSILADYLTKDEAPPSGSGGGSP